MGRPPIYPAEFSPKEFNQRDLPFGYHTRSWGLKIVRPPIRDAGPSNPPSCVDPYRNALGAAA